MHQIGGVFRIPCQLLCLATAVTCVRLHHSDNPAIRSLPRRQREAITLHGLEGLPLAEVADILAISESSAKTHVCRARRRLKELLTETKQGITTMPVVKGPS